MKYSRQRELILDAVCSQPVHPTADMVYQTLKKDHPNLSLGTVYRNLNLLSDIGSIQKLHISGMPDRFDSNTQPHDHFYCRACGGIYDIQLDHLYGMDHQVERSTGHRVERHDILFLGMCKECCEGENTVSSGKDVVE